MVKRPPIQLLVLVPLLAATIFCAAEGGLQVVRPDGLEIQITPHSTADYRPWAIEQFKPVDPALATVAGQDEDPTKVVIDAPGLDDLPGPVVLPTSNPNDLAQFQVTNTLPVAPSRTPTSTLAPQATSTFTDLPALSDTPTDFPTDIPAGGVSLTNTPTPDGPPASASSSTGKQTGRKKVTPPGQGIKGGNGGNGNGGKNK